MEYIISNIESNTIFSIGRDMITSMIFRMGINIYQKNKVNYFKMFLLQHAPRLVEAIKEKYPLVSIEIYPSEIIYIVKYGNKSVISFFKI